MKLFLVCMFATVCLSAAYADDSDTLTVPLGKMWGYGDPSMQTMASIDPPADDCPLSKEIGSILNLANLRERPKSAFVVTGSPSEALIAAHDIILKKRPMQSTFTADESLTLVFMSFTGFHMSIKPVELKMGKDISEVSVNYFVKISGRGDAQQYFALIPLGKLPAKLYRVNIKQVPGTSDGRPNSFIVDRAVVSPGFTFTVK